MMSFGILPEHPVLVFPAYQAFSNLFILFLSAHVKTVVNDHEPVVNSTLFASSGRGRPPGSSYTSVPPSTLRPTTRLSLRDDEDDQRSALLKLRILGILYRWRAFVHLTNNGANQTYPALLNCSWCHLGNHSHD